MSNLPTYTHLTWSYVSWKYTNNTKCKIAQSVHVSSDVSQAENTRIAQNVKSPNMHTSENIFLELKIHVHDRSTAANTWISTQCKFTHRVLYYRSLTYKSPQKSTSIHGKYIMKTILTYLQDLWLRSTRKEHNMEYPNLSPWSFSAKIHENHKL